MLNLNDLAGTIGTLGSIPAFFGYLGTTSILMLVAISIFIYKWNLA